MARGARRWTCEELEWIILKAGWEFDLAETGHRHYTYPGRTVIVSIPWRPGQAVTEKVASNIFRTAGVSAPS